MFKITRDTKPADVMLEGRPDVEIVAFGPRDECNITVRKPGTIYVYAKRAEGIAGWDGGTAHAKQWGYKLNEGSATFRSVICAEDGQCQWGRIVPRFRLTKDTDPATVMFEGHPEVLIDYIRKAYEDNLCYVVIKSAPPGTKFGRNIPVNKGNNHAHDENGYDQSGGTDNVWPRIVPRPTPALAKPIDVTMPLEAVFHNMVATPVTYTGTFTPADGTAPRIHVTRNADGFPLTFAADTGRDTTGHNVVLRNVHVPKVVTTKIDTPVGTTGKRIHLTVTEVDDVVTNVVWNKDK